MRVLTRTSGCASSARAELGTRALHTLRSISLCHLLSRGLEGSRPGESTWELGGLTFQHWGPWGGQEGLSLLGRLRPVWGFVITEAYWAGGTWHVS